MVYKPPATSTYIRTELYSQELRFTQSTFLITSFDNTPQAKPNAMQSEKWDIQENINSDEHDISSDELDEVLEIRINKAKARLSQNLENGQNSEGNGVVGTY